MTQQRRVILEELRSACTHPTAEELFDAVRVRLPRISLGTVYRNLELLSDSGEVRTLEVGGGCRRYDANVQDEHYHARCLSCGRIEDISAKAVTKPSCHLNGSKGFTVTGHVLTFTGYCPACSGKKGRSRR